MPLLGLSKSLILPNRKVLKGLTKLNEPKSCDFCLIFTFTFNCALKWNTERLPFAVHISWRKIFVHTILEHVMNQAIHPIEVSVQYVSFWVAKVGLGLGLIAIVTFTWNIFTGRNEVVAKVIFLHLSVILFTGEDVCLSACWDTTHTLPLPPPESRHPQSRHPPWSRHPPEQTPPGSRHPPGGNTPPPEQTHTSRSRHPPPKADSGIRSMSGRYASYWNAFLLFEFSPWILLLNWPLQNQPMCVKHRLLIFSTWLIFIIFDKEAPEWEKRLRKYIKITTMW